MACFRQAVLVLRWLLDGTRMTQLARDHTISRSTGYTYLHEVIAILAAQALALHSARLAAKATGYDHVLLDGTLIGTDRISTPGPTPGVDLWWSKKHKNHGGNIQIICAPDGWPLWTSLVRRPGTQHQTCLRTHPGLLDTLAAVHDDLRTLADLGYEGEATTIAIAFKTPPHGRLTHIQQQFNHTHNRLRAIGEPGNSLLKMTFKALRNISLCPGGSVTSSPPRWSFSTSSTAGPPERDTTHSHQPLLRTFAATPSTIPKGTRRVSLPTEMT